MALIVLAAVSGTGKSTLARALLERIPTLRLSVSHTTRAPRPGEVDGTHYHFTNHADFQAQIDSGDFAEWAEYAGNLYGTARATITEAEAAGLGLLFDVEVVGAEALKAAYPAARTCFILPPSWAELEARLRGRGTESEAVIARRLATGRRELQAAQSFDHLVVNDSVERAVDDLVCIYRAADLSTAVGMARLDALRLEAEAG